MPFAPVQLRAHRDDGSGDVALSWIRRTRFGGVGWELAEVPLNEEREAYRLEILDGVDAGADASRLPTPSYHYSAARPDGGLRRAAVGLHHSPRAAQRHGRAGRALETVVHL